MQRHLRKSSHSGFSLDFDVTKVAAAIGEDGEPSTMRLQVVSLYEI